ncbi:unnamed protein product [Durusdinium trenchii]|uniref:Peptidase M14 domain-containing protein n=1 Tax=Durusdinium trenchii TaxID=1381693 RepID=A0ABP0IEM1_9DINO
MRMSRSSTFALKMAPKNPRLTGPTALRHRRGVSKEAEQAPVQGDPLERGSPNHRSPLARGGETLTLEPPWNLSNKVVYNRLDIATKTSQTHSFAMYTKEYDVFTGDLKQRFDEKLKGYLSEATTVEHARRLASDGGCSLLREAEKSDVQLLLKHFVFTLLVPVNPDGYVYTWEVDRMWRKTRSDRPNLQCDGKVAGVDANRNWGFTFGKTADKSYESLLHDPCSSVFIGPKPFSEPETKAASDYMKQRQEKSLQLKSETAGPGYVAAFIDYHSYAEAMLPPWAYTAETPSGPDGVYQTEMTKSLNRAFFNTSGRTFHAGADVFPPDPGTGPDWAYGLLGIRATMTIELEGHSFCLPATQIQNVGQEQWAGVKALASFIQKHGGEPSTETGLFCTRLGTKSSENRKPFLEGVSQSIAPGKFFFGGSFWVLGGGNSLLVAANPSMEAPASYGWLIALTVRNSQQNLGQIDFARSFGTSNSVT